MVSIASASRPARSIAIIAGVVVVFVVAAVAVVLLVGPTEEASFPAGSPEATFQSYYQAFQSRDFATAYGFFSERLRRQVSADQYASLASTYGPYEPSEADMRIRVERIDISGERATLSLVIDRYYDSGLTIERSSYTRQIGLVREGGDWKIDELLIGVDPAPPVYPGT